MLAAADDVVAFSGYLTREEVLEQKKAEGLFAYQVKEFVFRLLQEGKGRDTLITEVTADIDDYVATQNGEEGASVALIREAVLARIAKEAGRPAWLRRTIRWFPAACGIALVIVYVTVRVTSGVAVNDPIESQAGLQQRAAALHKVVRYDDWASTDTRRGGWLISILLWPIEPSDAELAAANEFVGIVLTGSNYLAETRPACRIALIGPNDSLNEAHIALVSQVADDVSADRTSWPDGAAEGLLRAIGRHNGCPQ